MKRLLRLSIRRGRFSVPLWALVVALVAVIGVAGQAVGPVLDGSVSGTTNIVVEQTVLLSSAPQVDGEDDSAATVNDDGTGFTVAIETQVEQNQRAYLSLANESGADANARLMLRVPRGIDVEVDDCASTTEAQLNPHTWLFTVESDAGGTAFDSDNVDTGLADGVPTDPIPDYVAVDAVDACVLFAAYVDRFADEINVRKSIDGGSSWGTALTLTSTDVGDGSSVAVDAVDPETAYVAYVQDDTGGGGDEVHVAKVTAIGTTLTAAATATVDSDAGSGGVINNTSVDVGAPTANLVLVTWHDRDDGKLRVRAGSESGGTITLDAAKDIDDSASADDNVSIAVPDSTTAFVAWIRQSDGNKVEVRSVTISGTSLTLNGDETVDTFAGGDGVVSVAAPDASTVFVAWHDDASAKIRARAGSHSGGTITLGTAVEVDAVSADDSDVAVAAPDAVNVFVTWFDDDDANGILFMKLTASGTTLTTGSVVSVDANAGNVSDVDITAPDANNVFVAYFDDQDGDTFKVADSANGLAITIESTDGFRAGFVTILGDIIQTEN